MRIGKTHVRRSVLAAVLGMLAALAVAGPASAAEITSAGPLERIIISPDLNCQVKHSSDAALSFYGGDTGACGTFVVSGETLYGPSSCPACGNASPRTAYTPVSQSGPTGTGTAGNPYKIVTVVRLGTSGLSLEETDTYVVGDEAYRTDARVINGGGSAASGLPRAGDCYLQSSDFGFGRVDGEAISCVGDDPAQAGNAGTRIEQFLPVTAGSSFYESGYSTVWARIGARSAFADSCERCADFVDNGAGLSWPLAVAAGGSSTYSGFITFSPLGREPLSTTKTADSSSAAAGGNDGYTITVENPNPGPVTLNSITDVLPAGFSYRAGTTTEPGGGTDDPAISGQQLTWSGPYTVPGGGSVHLHFGVTVSSTAGTYYNEARADSTDFTVIPSGPTAPITVTTGPPSIRGTMAGEGRLTQSASNRLDYAYVLDCTKANNAPVKFKGTRNSSAFSLTALTSIACSDDPAVTPAKPEAGFDTMVGDGTGKVGSTSVTVHFEFVDGGAGGTGDSAFIEIRRTSDGSVLFSKRESPIGAYGGGTRQGRNTANAPGSSGAA